MSPGHVGEGSTEVPQIHQESKMAAYFRFI